MKKRTYSVWYSKPVSYTHLDVYKRQALQDALTAAEHANRAKSDFLSRMSHDIRTPMNAVLGMTKIGKKYVNNPERVMDCFQKIDVLSKLLIDLINEVLDMSKVESGQILLAEEEVNLAELVQGVVTMVQPLLSLIHILPSPRKVPAWK